MPDQKSISALYACSKYHRRMNAPMVAILIPVLSIYVYLSEMIIIKG